VKNADPYAIKFQQIVRKCICRTWKSTNRTRFEITNY